MTGKKTVALTGGSGTMGFHGFLELYSHAEEFDIRLLLRDSQKNRKKFAKFMDDPMAICSKRWSPSCTMCP